MGQEIILSQRQRPFQLLCIKNSAPFRPKAQVDIRGGPSKDIFTFLPTVSTDPENGDALLVERGIAPPELIRDPFEAPPNELAEARVPR
ncbi:hypothetical protein DEA98_26270 [Brucella pseudogrignonensis]|nr:hypothetical protein [Brucella pseudogrignonensis]